MEIPINNIVEEYREDDDIELCSCEINEDLNNYTNKWIDMGNYWLLDSPQKSDIWKNARLKLLTASNIGYAIGLAPHFKKPEEIAEPIRKGLEKYTDNEHTRRGIEREPQNCHFYRVQKKCRVKHIGLCVPKWDTRIGGSVDGLPEFIIKKIINENNGAVVEYKRYEDSEGVVEYKSPEFMYTEIVNYVRSSNKPDNYEHIEITHRVQMMSNMRILKRKWTDYSVYVPDFNDIEEEPIEGFIQRYPYDQEEWNSIYDGINEFFDTWLPGYKSNIKFT